MMLNKKKKLLSSFNLNFVKEDIRLSLSYEIFPFKRTKPRWLIKQVVNISFI